MAVDSKVNRSQLTRHFPALASDSHFHLLSDATRKYNCIGWAMGTDKRWVTSAVGADYWWPEGVERDSKQEALVKAFEAVGFTENRRDRYLILSCKNMIAESLGLY